MPAPVLLTDADLVDDEDITRVARNTQPTSVDVEVDCFSRTEPPPESRPRRKRALLVCVTGGLLLVAATCVSFLGRPLALKAFQRLDAESSSAARAPAMLSVAALSTQGSALAARTSAAASANPTNLPAAPSVAASPGSRPKLSAHSKRGNAAVMNRKKPTKPARTQRVSHNDDAKR